MQRAKPPRRRERSKRCRRGVWPRSAATGRFLLSHLLHLAPRHCHLSSARLDLRRRSQRRFESSSRSGTTASRSRPRRQWIHIRRFLSQGSPATSLPADPVSSTPIAATSTGSALRAAKAPFPSHHAAPNAAGGSDEQESEAAAGSRSVRECRRPAVAGCRRLSGSSLPGSARVTAGPAEQDSELCTMADFSRRVPLDELRGRGLIKGLQPEVLEQISSWPSAHPRGDEACTQLIAYTDGSARMTRAWPRLAAEAAFGGQPRRIPLLNCSWVLRVRPARSLRLPPSRAC